MKKKLIIAGIIIVLLVAGGYGVYRFGVNFLFDRYIMKTALSSLTDVQEGDPGEISDDVTIPPLKSEGNIQEPDNVFEQQKKQNEELAKKRLTNTEIITRVMRSQELTYKMASMVPYEEKRYVLQIVMSNFTTDELTEIAKNVSKGMTAEYKSKMIHEARSRLTAAQWQECLNIAHKYIEQIRPYVE